MSQNPDKNPESYFPFPEDPEGRKAAAEKFVREMLANNQSPVKIAKNYYNGHQERLRDCAAVLYAYVPIREPMQFPSPNPGPGVADKTVAVPKRRRFNFFRR